MSFLDQTLWKCSITTITITKRQRFGVARRNRTSFCSESRPTTPPNNLQPHTDINHAEISLCLTIFVLKFIGNMTILRISWLLYTGTINCLLILKYFTFLLFCYSLTFNWVFFCWIFELCFQYMFILESNLLHARKCV